MKTLVSKPNDLATYLALNADYLYKTKLRGLYIIQARMDDSKDGTSVIKFGIAGTKSGNIMSRLQSYLHSYGTFDAENACRGVTLQYLVVTEYNRDVENSQIAQLETQIKRHFRAEHEIMHGRGDERVHSKYLKEIITYIKKHVWICQKGELEAKAKDTRNNDRADRAARETTKKYRGDNRSHVDTGYATRHNTKFDRLPRLLE